MAGAGGTPWQAARASAAKRSTRGRISSRKTRTKRTGFRVSSQARPLGALQKLARVPLQRTELEAGFQRHRLEHRVRRQPHPMPALPQAGAEGDRRLDVSP